MRSPNFGPRKDGLRPDLIIIHYTAMASADGAIRHLCDPATQVSAHYVICSAGHVTPLVDEAMRAWHAGAGSWGGLGGWVIWLDAPTDAELDHLYRHCLFTATVSLYEGWGLPIGEGLSYGKTGVVSQTASMPEVGGDMVAYCDPASMQSVEAAVRRCLDMSERGTLEARIAAGDTPVGQITSRAGALALALVLALLLAPALPREWVPRALLAQHHDLMLSAWLVLAIAGLVLIEQLYRAAAILAGSPYHRA